MSIQQIKKEDYKSIFNNRRYHGSYYSKLRALFNFDYFVSC